MRNLRGFTLVEIVTAIFILILLLLLAVPSLTGVLADRRLRKSLDAFNNLVHQAQAKSVNEHRAYLVVWEKDNIVLRPEVFGKGEDPVATAAFPLHRGEVITLDLPAALTKKPPGEWIFWPSGTCEPAIIQFTGRNGEWVANYSPLTGQADIVKYAAR